MIAYFHQDIGAWVLDPDYDDDRDVADELRRYDEITHLLNQ